MRIKGFSLGRLATEIPVFGSAIFSLIILTGCSPFNSRTTPSRIASPSFTSTPIHTLAPYEAWLDLLGRPPVAWTTPLPSTERTALDGSYVKMDPDQPEWWICRRCPDYLPAGGLWRLSFDKGAYHVYYPTINWRSLGSYTLEGDRIYFFNDPYCQYVTGLYTWKLEDGRLTFQVVEDTCSFNLRQANLTKQAWLSCHPPNDEAGATGHWMAPEGCEP